MYVELVIFIINMGHDMISSNRVCSTFIFYQVSEMMQRLAYM